MIFGYLPTISSHGLPIGKPLTIEAYGIDLDTNQDIIISLRHPIIMGAEYDYQQEKWIAKQIPITE